MACSSCGQRNNRDAAAMAAAASAAIQSGKRKASYTVIAPNQEDNRTFDNYPDATAYKRKVNGVLTTSTQSS